MVCHLIGHVGSYPHLNVFLCMDSETLTFPTCIQLEQALFFQRDFQVLRDQLGILMALTGFSKEVFNLSLFLYYCVLTWGKKKKKPSPPNSPCLDYIARTGL